MEKKLKSWQGWLLFGGSMVVVFVLGLCVSALMERRAEVTSIFNNRKTVIKGIEARNELFKNDFPREYQTWAETAKTDFHIPKLIENFIETPRQNYITFKIAKQFKVICTSSFFLSYCKMSEKSNGKRIPKNYGKSS